MCVWCLHIPEVQISPNFNYSLTIPLNTATRQKFMSEFKIQNLMDYCPHCVVHYPSPKIYATLKPSPKK